MLAFHRLFLNATRDEINVLPKFSEHIHFVNMYQEYLDNYPHILEIVSQWRSMQFREFMKLRLN